MKLDHVNIATPDADGTAKLLSDLFDLPVVKRVEVADQGVKVVKLDCGNAVVELTEPLGPDTPVGRFLAKNRPGLHHMCFAVSDIRAEIARLKSKGVEFVNDEPKLGAAGLPIVFLHPKSTAGVLVELVEKRDA
ncbi:MAG: methylmalonyl-CoA epimerase [Planctomycetes bacterium]|nr:methylmalonyl-CoA epimerase [Planctomycetota bacterium]